MNDDNNSELEELRIDRQRRDMLRASTDGGARVTMKDSRVSSALRWFYGLVGSAIAGAILLAANNLYQLNVTVARGIDSDAARDVRINDHEERLRRVEHEVDVVEGKVFRGVDGYQQPERPHGH